MIDDHDPGHQAFLALYTDGHDTANEPRGAFDFGILLCQCRGERTWCCVVVGRFPAWLGGCLKNPVNAVSLTVMPIKAEFVPEVKQDNRTQASPIASPVTLMNVYVLEREKFRTATVR